MKKVIFLLSFVFALGATANTSLPVFDVSTDHDQFENVDAISQDMNVEAAAVVSVSSELLSVTNSDDPLTGVTFLIHSKPLSLNMKPTDKRQPDNFRRQSWHLWTNLKSYKEPDQLKPGRKYLFNSYRC